MNTQTEQIIAELTADINANRFPVNTWLPSAAELAQKTQCSPYAVRRAFRVLCDRGVLRSVKKKGTCVLRRPAVGQVLLMLSLDNHTNGLLHKAFSDAFVEAGFDVDLQPFLFDPSLAGFESVRQRIAHQAADTVLVAMLPRRIAPEMRPAWDAFSARFSSRVYFDFDDLAAPQDTVILPDPASAARVVAEHLSTLGHRRIGVVAGSVPGEGTLVERRASFLGEMLEMIGVECHPYFYSLHAAKGVASFIRRTGCTAWWAINDFQALGHILELQQAGFRIPDDLSVVGNYDTPWASGSALPLTSVCIDPPAIANAMVAAVQARKTGNESHGRRSFVRSVLVARASTAPAPAGS